MFARVEKYLKERVNDIVFINIKDNKQLDVKGFILDETIPLPIPVREVVNRVKDESLSGDISILKIVEGMIYIMGIDSQFKYNDIYKKFLIAFDKDIVKVILDQGFRLIEAGNKMDGLMFIYKRE